MSSPILTPFKTLLILDKQSALPLYQQISAQLIELIQNGTLQPGQRLLSSRQLAEELGLHRKTVIMALDELLVQGWLSSKLGSGTFVSAALPQVKPQALATKENGPLRKSGFAFEAKPYLKIPVLQHTEQLHLDDGFPDPRLAPLKELANAYKRHLLMGNSYVKLGYGDPKGSLSLRIELANYLHETRGLKITQDNLLIVRGTMMGFALTNMAFLKPSDHVIMGELAWSSARISVQHSGATIHYVPVDEHGIEVEAIAALCQQFPVRMVYLTPHHNYPTTVTLKADRRLALLKLAQQHRFILFEDDYDYDFHYQNKPLLPLTSADDQGLTLYSGSFTKSLSPAFRVGYLVAPAEVIEHLAYHRRIIDRQGDQVLENAFAELLHEKLIHKHLRQSLREYRLRRDFFCDALRTHFNDMIQFTIPEGGLSVWAGFDKSIDYQTFLQQAFLEGLTLSRCPETNPTQPWYNYCRLGFASSSLEELGRIIEIFKKLIR
ncbi:MAG: PLP-dependent aminotransferase family protein [Spirosomataceae bacterium]